MTRSLAIIFLTAVLAVHIALSAQEAKPETSSIPLPTSKRLTIPTPGRIGATNSFPATITLSPDGRYAALLNNGYGTQETMAMQSIAILDLKTNQITEFPDKRFGEDVHQSYFLGLVFGSDGKHLYASVGSITDPTGEKPGNTGNGIAVYSFADGKVTPERFIAVTPQALAAGKKVAVGLRKTAPGTAIPYPAGLALVSAGGNNKDRLLVANNLSDNAVLLDITSGKVLERFDLSTSNLVPSSFPYTCVATRDGRRAWCSLWNASQVAELDLAGSKVTRWIKVNRLGDVLMPTALPTTRPEDPLAPGLHPTALLLSRDERVLYIAVSSGDFVEAVWAATGQVLGAFTTKAPAQKYDGSYPTALVLSSDGMHLLAADSSLNAVAVFETSGLNAELKEGEADLAQQQATGSAQPRFRIGTLRPSWSPLGFIPTDWYPSALAVHGDDLIIATAKGQGTRPNKGPGKTAWEVRHREHPYIPTLLRGSIARLNIPSTLNKLDELTRVVEHDNLLNSDPGTVQFAGGKNPIKHVIYVIKENRTYDQILGDLKSGDKPVGDGDPSLTMYGTDITPNEHKLA
ncbi:MAG: phosphoesterase, partial [Candidatus Sulfotelmatobacter sp.]